VRLLLDTAVLIYAVDSPERLSKRAANALTDADNALEFSSVSLVEIAIKTKIGKLKMSAEVTQQALETLGARVLPYTADHAFKLFTLPLHHSDPFDRQIIAQALLEQVPIITPDEIFRLYKGLKILW
jgi:PIN domain nuclease of toxin-antitoxin system